MAGEARLADRPPPMPVAAPSVSVVVPCHNAAPWIEATLTSVLAQGWPGLEVIVVDDGSADDSADRVSRSFPQVRLLRQANAGVAAARNAGLKAATGDWVAFVDADDHWLPGKLGAQMALLAANPQARMACAPWYVWTSDDPHPPAAWLTAAGVADALPRVGLGPSGWIYPELLLSCIVWTSTVVAERRLLLELGGFDERLKVGEDYDLWLRASRRTPIVRADRPLALYRQHPGSLTRRPPAQNYEGVVVRRALRRWGHAGPDGRRADPRAVGLALARTWHSFGYAHLQRGSLHHGLRGAVQALRADWRHLPAWKLAVKCLLWPLWRHARRAAA